MAALTTLWRGSGHLGSKYSSDRKVFLFWNRLLPNIVLQYTGFGACEMTGIVKVMLTIVALVDGDHSLDAHARDIIANARQVFAPARVEIEKVELSELDEVDLPVSRRDRSVGSAHRNGD
jgi:hypothetical protein